MSKEPTKLDSISQRPLNSEKTRGNSGENPRSAGIELLLGEVTQYYEDQLATLNRELASARASAAHFQFKPNPNQSLDIVQLQAALNSADCQRVALQLQLDQAEEKIDSLANLYLAAYTLHRRHEWSAVMRGLTDILVNQIGSDSYVAFLRHDDGRVDTILNQGSAADIPTRDDVAELMLSPRIRYDSGSYVAIVPLVSNEKIVGCILISRLLPQKKYFEDSDKKLLAAVSSLAATAILASTSSRPITARSETEVTRKPREDSEVLTRPWSNQEFLGVIKVNGDSIATEKPLVPDIADDFSHNVQRVTDHTQDLSELPSSVLDLKTLLGEFSESPDQNEIGFRDIHQPSSELDRTKSVKSVNDSSRFRALSVDSPAPVSYAPGEDYLRFVGKEEPVPVEPLSEENPEGTDKSPKKGSPPGHREHGLLFRKSPIKRA